MRRRGPQFGKWKYQRCCAINPSVIPASSLTAEKSDYLAFF
jgi:hypothetical protein